MIWTACRLLTDVGRVVVLTSKYMLPSLRTSAVNARLIIRDEHYLTLGRTEAYIVSIYKSGWILFLCLS